MSEQARDPGMNPRPGDDSGGATPQAAPPEAPPPAALDALTEVVQKTYRPLAGEEQERVRTVITALQQASAALAAYPLTNADEPDPIFSVYRAD